MTNADKVKIERMLDNYYTGMWERQIRRRLKTLKGEYADLFLSGGGINYDGMPHNPNPGNPPLDAVCRIGDDAEKIKADISKKHHELLECTRTNRKVEDVIFTLSEVEQKILYMRFSENRPWKRKGEAEGIADKLHFTPDYLRKNAYPNILEKIFKRI